MAKRHISKIISEKLLVNKNQIASTMLLEFVTNTTFEISSIEEEERTIRVFGELVEIVAEALLDEHGVFERSELWGMEVGEASLSYGGNLANTIRYSTLYKKVIWNFVQKESEELGFSFQELTDLLINIDEIVTRATYGFTQVFVKHSEERLMHTQKEFMKISVPIVPISKNIAALPLIGEINEERAEILVYDTLNTCNRHRFEVLIIDLSGVQQADSMVIEAISKLICSLQLLGIEAIVTGVRPELSVSFVNMGVTLPVSFYSNLQKAIEMLNSR
ncbi:STAS domain-containing protein [Peribacillus sp. SCS-155]|uniref:STAS domain-containing protein n=1 Tax=Peribacillus sedimenti TaxID=3115297 RepID=UPI0039059C5C